jgi:hypothetical protein
MSAQVRPTRSPCISVRLFCLPHVIPLHAHNALRATLLYFLYSYSYPYLLRSRSRWRLGQPLSCWMPSIGRLQHSGTRCCHASQACDAIVGDVGTKRQGSEGSAKAVNPVLAMSGAPFPWVQLQTYSSSIPFAFCFISYCPCRTEEAQLAQRAVATTNILSCNCPHLFKQHWFSVACRTEEAPMAWLQQRSVAGSGMNCS